MLCMRVDLCTHYPSWLNVYFNILCGRFNFIALEIVPVACFTWLRDNFQYTRDVSLMLG